VAATSKTHADPARSTDLADVSQVGERRQRLIAGDAGQSTFGGTRWITVAFRPTVEYKIHIQKIKLHF
jgi:hypothetical protein